MTFLVSILSGLVFGFVMTGSVVALVGLVSAKLFAFESRVEALKLFGLLFLALFVVATLEQSLGVEANEQGGVFALFSLIGMVLGVVYGVRRYKEGRAEPPEATDAPAKPNRLKEAWRSFKEEVAKEMAKAEEEAKAKKEQKAKEAREQKVKDELQKSFDKQSADYGYKEELLLEYIDADGNRSRRKISNIEVNGSYIEAYCHKRNDFRTFRLDRVLSLADPLTGESIDDPELFLLRNYQ